MQRAQIRQLYLHNRTQLSAHKRELATQSILHQLNHFIAKQKILHIGGYVAHNGEINLGPWLKQQPATTYLPRILAQKKMVYCPASGPLKKNQFGIAEPQTEAMTLETLDMVLVPLIAFNKQCARLGYGAGYFDRCFTYKQQKPTANPKLIGIALASQQADFTIEPWDVRMDFVITEQGIIQPKG